MPTIYMEQSSIASINEADIRRILDTTGLASARYGQLDRYYTGQHAILQATKRDKYSPNNRLVCNMAKYVTDTAVGYFLGKPVIYTSSNEAQLAVLQDVLDYNDEQDHNTEIAKRCSIAGSCYEMLYLDADARIRLARIDPQDLIMIYPSGSSDPMAAIRNIWSQDKLGNPIRKVEYWTQDACWMFVSLGGGSLQLQGVTEHYWHDVPFVEYVNNDERLGDYEGIISLIDAYNRVQSNTANYYQYNDEAILKITGMGDVRDKDVARLRDDGAIVLEDNGDINWLIKEVGDTGLENYKKRLRDDMHIYSGVPNLTDEAFGGNLSGVAVSYKLWSLEQLCAIKERKVKRSLQRRIELITNIQNLQGGAYDYRDISIQFRRNKPQNQLEIAQMMTMLDGVLSRETRLQMWPELSSVTEEIDRLQAEQLDTDGQDDAYNLHQEMPPDETDNEERDAT